MLPRSACYANVQRVRRAIGSMGHPIVRFKGMHQVGSGRNGIATDRRVEMPWRVLVELVRL